MAVAEGRAKMRPPRKRSRPPGTTALAARSHLRCATLVRTRRFCALRCDRAAVSRLSSCYAILTEQAARVLNAPLLRMAATRIDRPATMQTSLDFCWLRYVPLGRWAPCPALRAARTLSRCRRVVRRFLWLFFSVVAAGWRCPFGLPSAAAASLRFRRCPRGPWLLVRVLPAWTRSHCSH